MRHWLLPAALCACVSNLLAAAAVVAAPSSSPPPSASGGWVLPRPTRSAARQERSDAPAPAASSDPNAAPLTPDAVAQLAQQILSRDDLAAYHGWIRYLQFRAAHASERFSDQPGAVVEDRLRLAQWTRKILDNPNALSELRGVTEWAYSSPVDGSGQPFRLNIPTDYDPAHPAPLSLELHGHSGNHLEDSTDMREHAGYFELSVLGRARGGNYRALSETDVLQTLDFVNQH